MGYGDIDHFLKGFGVDCTKKTSGVNSKWVYVKDLLTDAPDEAVLRIADELEIDHGFTTSAGRDLSDSRFWTPGHFRLFLSHVSSYKEKTGALQKALRPYGISAFVAHQDIEPTKEWQEEIEKALLSMDALAAILTPGFHDSRWTDQEIGVAVGRELPIIPIRRGVDPYGFIGKYQGFQAGGHTVATVANAVFSILSTHEKSRGTLAENLVRLLQLSNSQKEILDWLRLLERFRSIPARHLEKIQSNAPANVAITQDREVLKRVNNLLRKHSLKPILTSEPTEPGTGDDIPF
jgi:hypothetical protein